MSPTWQTRGGSPRSRSSRRDSADTVLAEIEEIALHPVDTVSSTPASPATAVLHVENELDAFGREQPPLFVAEAEAERRPALTVKAGLSPAAEAAQAIHASHVDLVGDTLVRYRNTLEALRPIVRRKPGQKLWFACRTGALLTGDIAGIAGAALLYGETYELAIAQAFSASVATVTAGLVGAEYRDIRLSESRERAVENLTELQRPFAHLFRRDTSGTKIVRGVTYVAIAIGALIACGIFALRASVEGTIGGLVYAGLAAGIAAASFISSYVVTDPAADVIDNAEKDYLKALKRQPKLSGSVALRRHLEAAAVADSISAEYTERGKAAQIAFEGLKHGTLRRNPGVAGHGPAPHGATPPTPTVGRRARSGGQK